MSAPSPRPRRHSSSSTRTDLFAAPERAPEGFRYHPEILSAEEEETLARELGAVVEAAPFPAFLDPLRRRAAELFGQPADAFQQVLINEYRPGAGIGWHRDKAQFDEVVGVSLLAPCLLRFRRRAGEAWERASLTVEPRSAYLLAGPARTGWQHSIPALDRLRYSITLRTLVASDRERA